MKQVVTAIGQIGLLIVTGLAGVYGIYLYLLALRKCGEIELRCQTSLKFVFVKAEFQGKITS